MPRQRSKLRSAAPALTVLVLGCLLSGVGAGWLARRIDTQAHLDFQRLSAATAAEITQRFEQPVFGLNGMRGLFAASKQVNRGDIRTYIESRDLRDEYAGVRGFGFIKPVLRKDLPAFIAAERADGAPEFDIHELVNPDLNELLVITAVEPASRNAGAVGLNIASEPTRRAGAQLAVDTGSPALSGAVELVQADRKTPGFLLFLSIYAKGSAPLSAKERRRDLLGVVFAPIVIDELLKALPEVAAGFLGVGMYDSPLAMTEGALLYSAGQRSAGASANLARFTALQTLQLPGRTVSLSVNSTPYFEKSIDRTAPWLLGGSGALVSVMLALLLFQQTSGRRRAERLAEDMTVDLDRLAQVVKHTSNTVLIGDTQGRVTWINEGFSRITGYRAEEAIGKTVWELVGNSQADSETVKKLHDAVTQGNSCRVEVLNQTKDGRDYWASIELQPQRAASGELIGFMEVGTDITQLRQRKAEAVRNWELLLGSISALDEAFVLYDPQDRLVLCNDKYKQIYQEVAHLMVPGVLFEDIIRAGAEIGQYADAFGREDEWVKERLAAHRSGHGHLIQRHTNGRMLRIVERSLPSGHVVGFRIDITELIRTTEAAQEASRAKSQFLANMSHEIRTPMNAILGMLTLLRKTELTARQADYALKSEGAARALLRLLNDILDFSKIDADKMTLDPQPFEFEQVFNNLSVILSTSTGNKPVEVLFDIDGTLPSHLVGDAMRLQQVLLNLGGNAVKFTEQGEVVLGVQVTQRQSHSVTLRISVRDSGIGIAPENQARIFSGFTQAESSTTRRFGGTGLGVAISQRLVSLMGGELQLESTLGKGSCFFFSVTLPVSESQPVQNRSLQLTDRSAPRVLIIDDNATAREVLQRTCQSLGWTADTLEGGAAALDALQADSANGAFPYRAIFVDWRMPGMDGWQTIQRIRALDGLARTTVIAMVTGQAREMLLKRSAADQALLDDYLVKPVTASMLLSTLLGTHHAGKPLGTNSPTVNAARLTNMRLLLVEDNFNNQQVARELLQAEGALVQVANDGQAGVDAIAHAEQPFDVVLMDLQMPVMDGFEATRVIRDEMKHHALPIVAMTANALASDREACLAAGMNDHIGKPFDLETLIRVLRQQAGWSVADVASNPPDSRLPDQVLQAAASAQVDIQAALHRLGGNRAVYQRMLSTFVRDVRAMPEQLTGYLDTQQVDDAGRLLHTLKGLAATMGSLTLAEHAAVAERMMTGNSGAAHHSAAADLANTAIHTALPGLEILLNALQQSAAVEVMATSTPRDQSSDANGRMEALQTLAHSLRSSDMAAIQNLADLQSRYGSSLGEQLVPLRTAIENLDFAGALRLCQSLLSELAT